MRIAKKIDELLKAELGDRATQTFDALEAAHVLGLSFGLGLASAPNDEARTTFHAAHERGVTQALELRRALDAMGIRPEPESS
jgi:hypothetical protein